MPLPMVHLYMSKYFSEYLHKHADVFDEYFYLGSIAPDAIHARAGSNRSDKHKTHLYSFTNDFNESQDLSRNNVRALLLESASVSDKRLLNFTIGYAIHSMLDMEWIKNIFQPLERNLRSGGLNFEDVRKVYYEETKACDSKLYAENPWMKEILDSISNIEEFDFYNILTKSEINSWKNITIGKALQDKSLYMVKPYYITVPGIKTFIDKMVPRFAALMEEWRIF